MVTTCTHEITGSWVPVEADGTLQRAYAPGYEKTDECKAHGATSPGR